MRCRRRWRRRWRRRRRCRWRGWWWWRAGWSWRGELVLHYNAMNSTDKLLEESGAEPCRRTTSCRNQAGLVLRPTGLFTFFFSGAATRQSLNRFPTRRGGFCMPGTGGAITGATDAVPVPSMGTATPVDTCLHPYWPSNQLGCTPPRLYSTCIYAVIYQTINQCCRTSCCAYFHTSMFCPLTFSLLTFSLSTFRWWIAVSTAASSNGCWAESKRLLTRKFVIMHCQKCVWKFDSHHSF
jgi:hypothetical protein